MNYKLVLTVLFHTLLGSSTMYYYSVLNSMEPWIKSFAAESILLHYNHNLTDFELNWVWSAISTSIVVGCAVGCTFIKQPNEYFGRRDTFMFYRNVVLLLGALLQVLAKPFLSVELLIIGRFLSGVALTHMVTVFMFLAECSPTYCRGIMSSLPSVGMNLWTFLGALLSTTFCGATESTWHHVLMYGMIPAFLHLLATPLIPKSPKHLYISEKDIVKAKKAILFYHGPEADVSKVLEEFENEVKESDNIKSTTLCQVITQRHHRWPLLLIIVAMQTLPFCGIDIAAFYSTNVILSTGVSNESGPIYTAFCIYFPGIFIILLASLMLDRWGRRALLLIGDGICLLGTVTLAVVTAIEPLSSVFASVLSIGSQALIYGGFSVGVFFIPPLLPGELSLQSSRSTFLALASLLSWCVGIVVTMSFPPLQEYIGTFAAVPIAVLNAFCWIFLFKYLPETKNKEVDEIVKKWMTNKKCDV